jgi:20S proteasome alpha/beta subunit
MKDYVIGTRELFYEAVERGAQTLDDIHAYVLTHDHRVSRDTIEHIMREHQTRDPDWCSPDMGWGN